MEQVTVYFNPEKGRLSFTQGEQLVQMQLSEDVYQKMTMLFDAYQVDDEEDAFLFIHECCLLFDRSNPTVTEYYEHQSQAAICVLIAKNGPFGLFQRQNMNLFHPTVCKGSHVYKTLFTSLDKCRRISGNPHVASDWFCQN